MLSFSKRIWQRHDIAVLTAALLACLVLALLPPTAKQSLGDGVVRTVFAPLQLGAAQIRAMIFSRAENRDLRLRLAQCQQELFSLQQAARDNDQLRSLLGLRGRSLWLLKPAWVAGREPGTRCPRLLVNFDDSIAIDAGLAAVSEMGLVGKVEGAGQGRAGIRTVFDPDSRVSAFLPRSRTLGIFRTDQAMNCILDRVPLRSDVKPGDTVLTSGYGGVFPPGLMLGRVSRVYTDPRQLTMHIVVKPSLDLNRLSHLFIIVGGDNPPLPELQSVRISADSLAVKPKRRASPAPRLIIRQPGEASPSQISEGGEIPGGEAQP
jgi:rod shape-determining protein MreC